MYAKPNSIILARYLSDTRRQLSCESIDTYFLKRPSKKYEFKQETTDVYTHTDIRDAFFTGLVTPIILSPATEKGITNLT